MDVLVAGYQELEAWGDVAGRQRPVASPARLARGACAGLRSST